MKYIFTLLVAAVLMIGCAGPEQAEADASTEELMNKQVRVSKEQFKAFLTAHKEDVQLVDVRTPDEHKAGSIDGSINIDYYSEDFQLKLETLDKEKPVMIYCKSGGRSGEALTVMKDMGFTTILELEGGYSGWE